MVFTADMLLKENYITPTTVDSVSSSTSYFAEAANYLVDMNREFDKVNKTLYKSLLEAGEVRSLQEAAYASYASSSKNIIDRFLEFIKRIFNKFVTGMNKLVKSDKYIIKHKKDFDKYGVAKQFSMKMFNYTYLNDDSFPAIHAYENYCKTIDVSGANVISITKGKLSSENGDLLLTQTKAAYDNFKESCDDWYKTFRALVIGKENESYTAAEYELALYEVFRNGESTPVETEVSSTDVYTALERFETYEKCLKQVTSYKNKLEREYRQIQNALKNTAIGYTIGDTEGKLAFAYHDDMFAQNTDVKDAYEARKDKIDPILDSINKSKIQQIQEMCTIHSLAFTKKIDAIKEAYRQDKKLLYAALNKVNAVHEGTETILGDDSSYSRLLEEYDMAKYVAMRATSQNDVITYVRECLAIESADLNQIKSINESVVDVAKNIIKKIIETIKGLFGKFSEKMSELVTSDATYLNKYKDIITKNPFKNHTINMYHYDANKLRNDFYVPQWNFDTFKKVIGGENTDDVEKQFISTYFAGKIKSDEELKVAVMEAIRGDSEEEFSMTALKPSELFDFCINFKATQAALDKDSAIITKSESLLNSELDKLASELKLKQRDEEREKEISDSDKTKEADKPKEVEVQNNSAIVYSSVMESYISVNEVKVGKVEDKGSSTTSSVAGKTQVNTGAKEMNLDGKTAASSVSTIKNNLDKNDEDKQKEIEHIKDRGATYFKCCGDIVAAKLTVASQMYKDYMKILRVHVSDYVGNTDATGKGTGTASAEARKGHYTDGDKQIEIRYEPSVSVAQEESGFILAKSKVFKIGEPINDDLASEKLTLFAKNCGVTAPSTNYVFMLADKYVTFANNQWVYVQEVKEDNAVKQARKALQTKANKK